MSPCISTIKYYKLLFIGSFRFALIIDCQFILFYNLVMASSGSHNHLQDVTYSPPEDVQFEFGPDIYTHPPRINRPKYTEAIPATATDVIARVDLLENLAVQSIVEVAAYDRLIESAATATKNGQGIAWLGRAVNRPPSWVVHNNLNNPDVVASQHLTGGFAEVRGYYNASIRAANKAAAYAISAINSGVHPCALNAFTRVDVG